MALHFTDDEITSDEGGTAVREDNGMWFVPGYPGRSFTRDQAITALTIEEERARPNPDLDLIRDLESEL